MPWDLHEVTVGFPIIDINAFAIPLFQQTVRRVAIVVIKGSHAAKNVIRQPSLIKAQSTKGPRNSQMLSPLASHCILNRLLNIPLLMRIHMVLNPNNPIELHDVIQNDLIIILRIHRHKSMPDIRMNKFGISFQSLQQIQMLTSPALGIHPLKRERLVIIIDESEFDSSTGERSKEIIPCMVGIGGIVIFIRHGMRDERGVNAAVDADGGTVFVSRAASVLGDGPVVEEGFGGFSDDGNGDVAIEGFGGERGESFLDCGLARAAAGEEVEVG
mmetsp:Transcript_224/g.476  ORF Transcript_224/g.476 Transcript_224/m.476 type:complete len:272 (-) Transcript_224:176-991(-)